MSQSYKDAGVDIVAGDSASRLAATAAKTTFSGRVGKIGAPVDLPGGFAGMLDFGDFYLVQCCDTVGTKIDLAEQVGDFSGLGFDLLAMVADDAVCLGAEVVSLTNTFETGAINSEEIGAMMNSLAVACRDQNIVIAGGEIAEVGKKVNGTSWGADAVGIVEKNKVITGEKVRAGDAIIALKETGFRCNGYSLVRKILKEISADSSLLQKCVRPSTVYHSAVLSLCGRYREPAKISVSGIAHITGGGISGNLFRILKNGCGAKLNSLFFPPEEMIFLAEKGGVNTREFYQVWNGGNGMLLVIPQEEAKYAVTLLGENGVSAQICGEITDSGKIELLAWNEEQIIYEK
ncbi:hypothetical protein IPN35_05530 [Candidatus Peregrinibacteria bacterium]|nr:MAG: hypothetical protein IPN35_05530 [Candidatus Peregrinibacteria bacterium]